MDNTIKKEYRNERERLKAIRSLHPNAYALSANETIQTERINKIVIEFFNTHREFVQIDPPNDTHVMSRVRNVFNQESVTLIKELLKNKRINLDNAYSIANRVLNGKWFEVYAAYGSLNAEDFKHLAYITSDKPTAFNKADREQYPKLYEVWDNCIKTESKDKLFEEAITHYDYDPEGLRDALSLGDEYLYLCWRERDKLELIKRIYEFGVEPFIQDIEGFLSMPNSNGTTALTTIGTRAINNAYYDDINERFEMVTTTGVGVKVTTNNRDVNFSSKSFVNMDKLVRQIANKAMREGYASKHITITLDEFKTLRGIRDDKEARKQLSKAAEDLYNSSIEYSFGKLTIKTRYIEAKAEIKNSSITFYISSAFFNNLKENRSIAYIPYGLFTIPTKSDNAYSIAMFLADNKRRNLGKANENRVSINKLLEITSLPTVDEIKPNRYKQQIIDPFINALNTAASTGDFTYKIVLSNGKPLTRIDEINLYFDYELFTTCLIEVTWLKEPEVYTQVREEKVKQAAADHPKPKRKGKAK